MPKGGQAGIAKPLHPGSVFLVSESRNNSIEFRHFVVPNIDSMIKVENLDGDGARYLYITSCRALPNAN